MEHPDDDTTTGTVASAGDDAPTRGRRAMSEPATGAPRPARAGRPTLLFAPETLNLAEVTRCIEIARVARRTFDVVFVSYDGAGRNHRWIEGAGFPVEPLRPSLDDAAVARFWAKNRGDAPLRDYFSDAELEARVAAERAAYARHRPRAVVTGFCLSTALSARLAGVPLVWINQTTWFDESFRQYATIPDALDVGPLRWWPERARRAAARRGVALGFWLMNRGFNRVARRHGVTPFVGSRLLEGDYNLLAEPEGFSGIDVPERLRARSRFIGPLYGGLDLPVPAEIERMPRDLPIVYFAMGSSGDARTIEAVVSAFAGQPFRVIAPVRALLERRGLTPPPNVVVTDWLPAEKVNPLADVSVLHGGIGTLMTACLAGTPVVGIPNGNPEQEANLECLVRRGVAVRLNKRRVRPDELVHHIQRFLTDPGPRRLARELSATMRRWDGPENAARFLEERFA